MATGTDGAGDGVDASDAPGGDAADATAFGRVSRVRGVVFEYLTLGASLVGILALGILLAYVSVDAFGLAAAADGWLLTFVATLVAPVLGLWLYGVGDERLAVRAAVALVGGALLAFLASIALAIAGVPIPGLRWPLLYWFAVVVPLSGYVLYVGSQEPVGATAVGLLGRLVGGLGLGLALVLVFVVFEPQLWLLLYTLAVLPALALHRYASERPASRASLLPVPVGLLGYVVAVLVHEFFVILVPVWLQFLWAIVLPAAVLVGLVVERRHGRRAAVVAGGLAVAVAAVGAALAAGAGVEPYRGMLLALAAVVPAALYVDEVLDRDRGRLGLVAPVVVAAGLALGSAVVRIAGFAGPDPWLTWSFLSSPPSRIASDAGLFPAIVGSVLLIALVAVLSFGLGVATAVFLEDYTADEGLVGSITRLVQVNIANLAAVPSVVYGLLGLGLFANLLGLGVGTVVTAAVTLALLVLPITIIAAQEAVRSVPDDLRQASYGMGATRWQTTRDVVIPQAMPGILTGTILALGRAIGETAPLIMIGAATTKLTPPSGLFDRVSAMPMQIFAWYDFPQEAFQRGVLPAAVVTLLLVLVAMNGTAIVLRNRYQRGENA